MRRLLVAGLLLLLAGCAAESDETVLTPVSFQELPGWTQDNHAEAFKVFADSCYVNESRPNAYTSKTDGQIGDLQGWRAACMNAYHTVNPTTEQARSFFEQNFAPFRVSTEREPYGQLTGYYEPLLRGSRIKQGRYTVPVYGVPVDFVKGASYLARKEIEAGSVANRAPVLLYVDDPVMLFFLHIQGSGKVQLDDGSIVGLQYAAQNGHPYVAIGGVLRELGELEQVSLQTIREWLYAHPDRAQDIMNENPSYIFFALAPGDQMAKGALGLPLTGLRSLAVDDDRSAYGMPIYISATHPNFYTGREEPLNRLMVAQDTGGALRGPHRGDIFFGRGEAEEWMAGKQNSRGDVFWLLPAPQPPSMLGMIGL